jgi:hypothetical protein
MKRIIAFIAFLLIFIVGCGPKEGLVVDKIHKPDLSYWGTSVSCSGTRCTTGPHWYYNPEEFKLVLETPDGDVKDKHVKKKIWYKTNIGDYYKES